MVFSARSERQGSIDVRSVVLRKRCSSASDTFFLGRRSIGDSRQRLASLSMAGSAAGSTTLSSGGAVHPRPRPQGHRQQVLAARRALVVPHQGTEFGGRGGRGDAGQAQFRGVARRQKPGVEHRLAALRMAPERDVDTLFMGQVLRRPHGIEHRPALADPDQVRVRSAGAQAGIVGRRDDVAPTDHVAQAHDLLEPEGRQRRPASWFDAAGRMRPGDDRAAARRGLGQPGR